MKQVKKETKKEEDGTGGGREKLTSRTLPGRDKNKQRARLVINLQKTTSGELKWMKGHFRDSVDRESFLKRFKKKERRHMEETKKMNMYKKENNKRRRKRRGRGGKNARTKD